MQKLMKIIAMSLGLALVATACGDDSAGGNGSASLDDPIVQAIVDEMMTEDGGFTNETAEAECFATRVVGDLGDERIAELGITAEDVGSLDEIAFTEGEASGLVDDMFDCMPVAESFAEEFAVDGMSEEDASCLAGAFDESELKSFFVASFVGEEPENFFGMITAAMAECGVDPTAGG